MTRTTRADLDKLAAVISQVTGEPHEVTYAYGQPRLYRAGGSVEVSPRLPTGELALWMRAYIAGAVAAADRQTRALESHADAYGDEHDEACPLCGVDAQPEQVTR